MFAHSLYIRLTKRADSVNYLVIIKLVRGIKYMDKLVKRVELKRRYVDKKADDFGSRVHETHPFLKIHGFNGLGRHCMTTCKACGAEQKLTPKAILATPAMCIGCEATNVEDKYFESTMKFVKLQAGVKSVVEGLDAVVFKFKKQQIEYVPRFVVNKRDAVDYKTLHQLLAHWDLCVAKAKACNKLGLKYTMVVVSKTLGATILPSDWWTKQKQVVESNLHGGEVITALAVDPGTTNGAWSVVSMNKSGVLDVLASGKIYSTVTDLTGNQAQGVMAFKAEISAIATKFKVNAFAVERFQARGFKGPTIEMVNVMIGLMAGHLVDHHGVKLVSMIPPAEWKNPWNRKGNLEEFYAKVNCVVHQTDSIGIGIYCLCKWLGLDYTKYVVDEQVWLAKAISRTNTEVNNK